MKSAACLVLDNEAVQALLSPRHPKHRRSLEILQAAARRNTEVVVPTTVRVEAEWDRSMPGAAVINRQRIVDDNLDVRTANTAAALVRSLRVSVADAHIGAVLAASPEKDFAVATSDVADIERIASHLGRRVIILRV